MDASASTVASVSGAVEDGPAAGRGEEPVPDDASGEYAGADSVGPWWTALAIAIVVTPIVVATSRALLNGWLPLGDNGLLLVRARDVGTTHHPLLGTWTSASLAAGEDLNNPGPLYFDLIAGPIKLLGPWVGLAVGVMLVNVAAVVFAVVVAGRIAGRLAMLSLAAAIAVLEWSLGSEMLFDVWQPNALVLPALAFTTACWGLATARLWLLPVIVGVGSLLIQTHLSYVYLVSIAALGAGALAIARLRSEAGGWVWGRWRQPLVVTLAVGVLAWIQPIIEQLTASGRGNLAMLLDASSQDMERLGPRLGVRLLAQVVAVPPFWGRPSYDDAIPVARLDGSDIPIVSLPVAVAALGALVALLVVAWWLNRAAGRRALTAMVATSLVWLLGSLVSLTLMPAGLNDLLTPHQMRWLWAVGAFVFASLVASLLAAIGGVAVAQGRDSQVPRLVNVVAAVGVVAAIAALPTHVSGSGPTADRDALPFAKELAAGLERLEGRGPVLFDASTLTFAEPYSGVVFAVLQDRGITFYVDLGAWHRQLGSGRQYSEGDAAVRIWLRSGGGVVPAEGLPPGVEEVAAARELSDQESINRRRAVVLYAAPIDQRPDQ